MNIKGYGDLADGINKLELQPVYEIFFADLKNDSYSTVCEKIELMCDRQWHTYELPEEDVKKKMTDWIMDNWSDSDSFLELVLLICYSFGLKKDIYEKAFNIYSSEDKSEYESDLINSKGADIDPYWSMMT